MKQIPGMVLINRILAGFEQRCVALDDRYGAWLATRHLIQQGIPVSAISAPTTRFRMLKIVCKATTRR
jgi:DNA-binding LacI/PurR family transcriptional regulator